MNACKVRDPKIKSDYDKCPNCGAQLPDNARICWNCGICLICE